MKHIRLLAMLLLLVIGTSGCLGIYFKPYRLAWNFRSEGEVATKMTRAWLPRAVYYCAEPHDGAVYSAAIRMVDAIGQDLPSPVWGTVDLEFGRLEQGPEPNTADFWPNKRGNVIVTATQDDFITTTQVIILPTQMAYINENIDFDNDGQPDFVMGDKGYKYTFPYGATQTELLCVPEYMGDVADDVPAPGSDPVSINDPGYSQWIFVFNTSGGGVYAAMVRGWDTHQTLTWRKIRDAA